MGLNKNIVKPLLTYLIPSFLLLFLFISVLKIIFAFFFWNDFFTSFEQDNKLVIINIAKGFVKSCRFDFMLISYIMIPQFVLLLLYGFLRNFQTKTYYLLSKILLLIPTSLILLIYMADIPYFNYFWKHLSPVVFKWLAFKETYTMLLHDKTYIAVGIFAILYILLYIKCVNYIAKRSKQSTFTDKLSPIYRNTIFVLCCALLFLGTRGHFHLKKLTTEATFFTMNNLLQQYSMGAAYSFYNSFLYGSATQLDYEKMMPSDKAIALVKEQLDLTTTNQKYLNPLSREVSSFEQKTYPNANIVFIFMESLSYNFLNKQWENMEYLPFIDSISHTSIFFDTFYSDGSRTNHGIGAALTGMSSRIGEPILEERYGRVFHGIVNILKDNNYYTSFFITHDKSFDNIGLFARKNNIKLYSLPDYDPKADTGYFGVSDKYLYNISLNKMNEMPRPFFTSILTIGNHYPLVVPEDYKKYKNNQFAVLRSVDDNLKNFLTQASKTDWYANTIFVIFGDHGTVVDPVQADMQISVNHIPLILYSPLFENQHQTISTIGTQIDLGETVLGMLGIPHLNNTMGVNMLSPYKNKYVAFSDSENVICASTSFIYCYNPFTQKKALYQTGDKNWSNVIDQYPDESQKMHDFAISRIVTSDYLLKNNLTDQY